MSAIDPNIAASGPTSAPDSIPKNVVTIMVVGKPLDAEPALLDNIIARMQERAGIANWYVDGNGWFWAKTATEAQATRCLNKMD